MTDRHGGEQLDERELNDVLEKIEEIVRSAFNGDFIFRGENSVFETVSSGLLRRLHPWRTDSVEIEVFQSKILEEAKRFTTERDNEKLLSELQHYESGLTNLVDFTTDYLIALFFACDGAASSNGRVILLRRENADTFEPAWPINRVIAQKSVFVRPSTGVVAPDAQVPIPSELKQSILRFLRIYHGITPHTIYNDLHGFIHHWNINQHASRVYFAGVEESLKGNHNKAIQLFDEAQSIMPHYPVLLERGRALLAIGDLEKAFNDLDRAVRQARYFGNNHVCGAANNGRGTVYRKQGRHADAVVDFKSAVEYLSRERDQENELEEAYSNLVVALMETEQYESALAYVTNARDKGYDSSIRFQEDYGDVDTFESSRESRVPETLAQALLRPASALASNADQETHGD